MLSHLYLKWYSPGLCEYPPAKPSPSSEGPGKCAYFKSFRRHQQLAPPSPDRLHGTVRISFLGYSPTGEKTTVFHVFFAYHIRLLCLLISSLLFSGSEDIWDLENPRKIQPRPSNLTLLLRAFSIVRRLLSTSHEGGVMDTCQISPLLSLF